MSEHAHISSHNQAYLPAGGKSVVPAQQQMSGKSGMHSSGKTIQYKLSIGAVDDPLEHEADAMADHVMRMPEPNFIQRKCSHCEEEAQRKPMTSFIQKKENSNSNTVSNTAHNQIQSTKGGGSAIPANTKTFMENRFGTDFSNVRIHSGGYASQLSKELNARAFTVGNDIYFNDGKFSPDSSEGKHLLAHELTHTVQQGVTSSAPNNLIQRNEEEDKAVLKEAPPQVPVPDAASSNKDRERARTQYLAQRDTYRERLRNAVLAPIEEMQRADAITFINRIRSLGRMQATLLVNDDIFFTRIRRWFNGKSLWSVFSMLYFNNHIPEPYLRLNYAVMNNDARLLTDMLSIVISQYASERYFDMLREVCITIFHGDRLLPEILRIIDHRDDEGTSHQLSGDVKETHYELNAAGQYALATPSNHFSADAYFSGSELRVIVRIRFVDGSDAVNCNYAGNPKCQPFYFLGANAHYYDEWQGYITSVWNNKFNITNGKNNYAITFVPIFISEHDDAAANVRIISNSNQHCASDDTWARSYSSCWHLSGTSKNSVAHEFGHLIGASDEYKLPGSIKEVNDAGITGLNAEDLSLTTVEGITGTAAPVSTSGHGHTQDSLMASTNNEVYARHLTRLIHSLNSSLPAGSAGFRITARS